MGQNGDWVGSNALSSPSDHFPQISIAMIGQEITSFSFPRAKSDWCRWFTIWAAVILEREDSWIWQSCRRPTRRCTRRSWTKRWEVLGQKFQGPREPLAGIFILFYNLGKILITQKLKTQKYKGVGLTTPRRMEHYSPPPQLRHWNAFSRRDSWRASWIGTCTRMLSWQLMRGKM